MSKLKIAFVHPDLGIGGAERLVVDAAVALQQRGHSVQIHTSYHSPSHSFPETSDGTLHIVVHGQTIPREFKGRFQIVFAIIKSYYLAAWIVWQSFSNNIDVLIVDQLSASIPLLRLTNTKVISINRRSSFIVIFLTSYLQRENHC